jgi:hypothetical protein
LLKLFTEIWTLEFDGRRRVTDDIIDVLIVTLPRLELWGGS